MLKSKQGLPKQVQELKIVLVQEMVEVHQRAGEMKAQRPVHVSSNAIEAQPNSAAPLLRDEKARREWIEHELDLCCQVGHLEMSCKVDILLSAFGGSAPAATPILMCHSFSRYSYRTTSIFGPRL